MADQQKPSNSSGNGQTLSGLTNLDVAGRGRGRGAQRDTGFSDTSESEPEKSNNKRKQQEKVNERAKRGRSQDGRNRIVHTKPKGVTTKQGTTGKFVNMLSNHFEIKPNLDFEFVQYRVDFAPEIDNAKLRKQLINQHAGTALKAYIFDGANLLYLTRRLNNFELISRSSEGDDYNLKFKDTGIRISFDDELGNMILNIMLRRAMNGLNMQEVQRNLYDPGNRIILRDLHVELWPGYLHSIRQHETNILVCCEIIHKVMREDTVLDILRGLLHAGGNYRDAFEKEVIGKVVLTAYNNKTYSIIGVEWNIKPTSTFPTKDGAKSFMQYYTERYGLNISDGSQPLLITRPSARDIRAGRTDPVLLVPELCRTTGLTDSMRSNFQMMKIMGEYTRMDPTKRVERLKAFSKRINETPASSQVLSQFGVKMDANLLRVQGRILPCEQILFGGGKIVSYDPVSADWTPAIRNNSMYHNEDCIRWVLMYPSKLKSVVEDFLQLMLEVAKGLNYHIGSPKLIPLNDDRPTTYSKELYEIIKKDPKFIMCVLMGQAPGNVERYALIKKITCVNNFIPTQCILGKTMTPKRGNPIGSLRSVATKVVMQINCKLGGSIWNVKMPIEGVMVCGFDVSHCTNNRSQSYGAFVASMDLKRSTKYFSSVLPHSNGEECCNNIKLHMKRALNAWVKENQTLPKRILFYRDGVGDGQIEYIYQNEVKELLKVFEESSYSNKPQFAFIIVSKRINTRFFAPNNAAFTNPLPGTVVDNYVTLPERYDFFIVSQSVRQGTVSPTSYNIIYDTFGLSADRMQQLTYKMCHLYYNWCGTTSVPAPCQYAHKLSVLAAQYLHEVPNDKIGNKLYFL